MLMALVALASVIMVPIMLMLAACLLARIESALVPEIRSRVLPAKPSPAPPSRHLTLVAEESLEAPQVLPHAS